MDANIGQEKNDQKKNDPEEKKQKNKELYQNAIKRRNDFNTPKIRLAFGGGLGILFFILFEWWCSGSLMHLWTWTCDFNTIATPEYFAKFIVVFLVVKVIITYWKSDVLLECDKVYQANKDYNN